MKEIQEKNKRKLDCYFKYYPEFSLVVTALLQDRVRPTANTHTDNETVHTPLSPNLVYLQKEEYNNVTVIHKSYICMWLVCQIRETRLWTYVSLSVPLCAKGHAECREAQSHFSGLDMLGPFSCADLCCRNKWSCVRLQSEISVLH